MRVDATSLPVKAARYLKFEHTAHGFATRQKAKGGVVMHRDKRPGPDTGRLECRIFLETLTDVRECFSVAVSEG